MKIEDYRLEELNIDDKYLLIHIKNLTKMINHLLIRNKQLQHQIKVIDRLNDNLRKELYNLATNGDER